MEQDVIFSIGTLTNADNMMTMILIPEKCAVHVQPPVSNIQVGISIHRIADNDFFIFIIKFVSKLIFPTVLPAPTCDDGIKNQNEEEVDCGGTCLPCGKIMILNQE